MKHLCLLGIGLALASSAGCGRVATTRSASGPSAAPGVAHTLDLSGLSLEAARPNEPESVGIFFCLDVSGSMEHTVGGKRKIDIARDAMRQVIGQIAAFAETHPNKRILVGVCSFNNQVNVIHPLQPFDRGKLENAVAPLRAMGGTAIGDAMTAALRELLKGGVEKRAVIVLTDGENNAGVAPERVAQAIKENRNNLKLPTASTELFLVAFDVDARHFDGVKAAGAAVKAAGDQKSLEAMFQSVVDEVLLEKPD